MSALKALGCGMDQSKFAELIKLMDKDKDGRIEISEFMVFLEMGDDTTRGTASTSRSTR